MANSGFSPRDTWRMAQIIGGNFAYTAEGARNLDRRSPCLTEEDLWLRRHLLVSASLFIKARVANSPDFGVTSRSEFHAALAKMAADGVVRLRPDDGYELTDFGRLLAAGEVY
jgi:hypothetical protein